MKSYDFIIDLDPFEHTHQAGTKYKAIVTKWLAPYKPVIRVMSYPDTELKRLNKLYKIYLKRHKPTEPLEGALKLRIDFYKHQDSIQGKKIKKDVWKVTKPDCDNWAKAIIDCMKWKSMFFTDDNQIVHLTVTKHATPGDGYIRIYIGEIDE